MEIFSELDNLDQKIYTASEPIENFRYFRYIRRLFERDNQYGITDQFAPSKGFIVDFLITVKGIREKAKEIQKYSYRFPAHLPQHWLVQILKNALLERMSSSDELLLNTEFVDFKPGSPVGVNITCFIQGSYLKEKLYSER